MIRDCEKFDILNNKWMPMPALNEERGNPGTFLSEDKRYLYAFQGFVNRTEDFGGAQSRVSEALKTIEVLDL